MLYTVNNESLKPTFEIDEKFMDQKIKELVLQYNYTLNPKGVYEAIKFMYTYWPDRRCKSCIRTQFIHVSLVRYKFVKLVGISLFFIFNGIVHRCYQIFCM